MRFSFDRNQQEEIVIYRFKGRLFEHEDAGEMLNAFEQDLKDEVKKFVVNLSELENLNSSGLNLLINMFTKARNNYGELFLTELTERIKDLLITTKLQNIFVVEPTEGVAIDKISS